MTLSKKSWITVLSTAVVGAGLLAGGLNWLPAHAQENAESGNNGRKVVYLFSSEFPPHNEINYHMLNENPAVQETRFWQLLDKEMRGTSDLSLTENMENADYRVELRCGGVANCANLVVDIKNLQRDVLASFTIKGILPYWGLFGGAPDLPAVAHTLSQRLEQRIKLIDQGGYGHTD